MPGEGEGFPDYTAEASVDATDAFGFRIMAQAGVLPEEIAIKKEVDERILEMRYTSHPADRKATLEALATPEIGDNIARESCQKFPRR